ncbi:MAG: PglZ domain-containing protein [Methylococcales bacterium]|nr:PglZ domain-containing protein [Methylococcales bacterium]
MFVFYSICQCVTSIIDENDLKIAVIVGDGVAFECACQVAAKVANGFKLTKNILLADIPSETENNMSRIYMANGVTEKVQSNREKYLRDQNPDTPIDFIKLDEVNEDARPSQYLICTYKDIDDMGEKLQHKALKHFPKTINYIAEKITLLLNSGYAKVVLITDHGFVLTGLLSESDKIVVTLNGVFEKAERYIRTVEPQTALLEQYIEVNKPYENFNYLYFSKTMNPFKTTGVYGFSHGGLAPQELITPYFCWSRSTDDLSALAVTIQNKESLKNVTGEIFQLKIQADKGDGDLFSLNRKVYLVFFSNKVQTNKSDVFTLQKEQVIAKDYTFDGHSEIEVQLLDAQTKQQIDKAVIKQNKDRDLGGLF